MPNENEIRDQLAGCLSLIEPGLELVDTNYMLRNPHGSDGCVDLLARDSSSAMVIIELKRADQSAREALHEIGKYADLLARDKGVPRHRIRTLIVSTTWRELLIPFSYYAHQAEISIEGFELSVDSVTGQPLSATFVEPVELPEDRSMTASQRRIEIPAGRSHQEVWDRVTRALSSSGALDHRCSPYLRWGWEAVHRRARHCP